MSIHQFPVKPRVIELSASCAKELQELKNLYPDSNEMELLRSAIAILGMCMKHNSSGGEILFVGKKGTRTGDTHEPPPVVERLVVKVRRST
jgi:hypothetical protein